MLDTVDYKDAGRSLQRNVLGIEHSRASHLRLTNTSLLCYCSNRPIACRHNMSFITSIVHALVEQDAVCAVVLSASCADRHAAHPPFHANERARFRTQLPGYLRVVRSTLKGNEIHAHRPLIFFLPSLLENGLFRCEHLGGSTHARRSQSFI